MKQEDEDLLLKDLCARLPYNPMVEYKGKTYNVLGIVHGRLVLCKPLSSLYEYPLVEEVKLYLFPLSSMTEEQKENLDKAIQEDAKEAIEAIRNNDKMFHAPWRAIDWLNANNFDYRGLIPKGRANDATNLNIY